MEKMKPNTVRIIVTDTRHFSKKIEEIRPLITPYYREKYENYSYREEAVQELVSGYLLREYLGVVHDEQITFQSNHKPFLTSGEAFFNLSHSNEYVVLAMADGEVGVDIEKVRTCHEPTVKKWYSRQQREELNGLKGILKDERFTQMWTEWEARLKWLGTGFLEEKDREEILQEKCNMYTIKVDEYYLSCAVDTKVTYSIEYI